MALVEEVMDSEVETEHGTFCNCEECCCARGGFQICETCGCIVGGSCPESTEEERAAYAAAYPE